MMTNRSDRGSAKPRGSQRFERDDVIREPACGLHQGQQPCGAARTGRTHGCTRPVLIAKQKLLRRRGRPHMDLQRPHHRTATLVQGPSTPSRQSDHIRFAHRQLTDGDIYFVSNSNDRAETVEAHFRVTGKMPELWHAATGLVEPVSYRIEGAKTIVPLSLDADQSVHVVFRKPAEASSLVVSRAVPVEVGKIDSPWRVPDHPAPRITTSTSSSTLSRGTTGAKGSCAKVSQVRWPDEASSVRSTRGANRLSHSWRYFSFRSGMLVSEQWGTSVGKHFVIRPSSIAPRHGVRQLDPVRNGPG